MLDDATDAEASLVERLPPFDDPYTRWAERMELEHAPPTAAKSYPRLSSTLDFCSDLFGIVTLVPTLILALPAVLIGVPAMWLHDKAMELVKRLAPAPEPLVDQPLALADAAMQAEMCGDYGLALDLLERALEADPHNPALHAARAGVYSDRLGWHDCAIWNLRIALCYDPDNLALLKSFVRVFDAKEAPEAEADAEPGLEN
jgi:hypothetical protein